MDGWMWKYVLKWLDDCIEIEHNLVVMVLLLLRSLVWFCRDAVAWKSSSSSSKPTHPGPLVHRKVLNLHCAIVCQLHFHSNCRPVEFI